MDRITTIIKREWLRKIVAGTKRTEYRELKPYWTKKLATVETPFELRLINGMQRGPRRSPSLLTPSARTPAQGNTS
jgi:hypothetical protein